MHANPSSLPRRLGAVPPLDPLEEVRLAREYARTGSPVVANRLVCANLRLVIKIASEYRVPAHAEFADLVQDGTIGLLEAVRRYDPERGVRLANYGGWWIRAFVLRGIMGASQMVCAARGRQGRRDFFAGRTGPRELSLDAAVAGAAGRSEIPLMAVLADPQAVPADRALEQAQLEWMVAREARAMARGLRPRERVVLRARILAQRPAPVRRLAERFAVTRQRIHQIEAELARRLRARLTVALEARAA